jgi:TP901 family phage tail tape measure protein
MATAAELEVVMKADVAQATAALKRVERQLNDTTKAGGKTQKGMKGLSGGFSGMMQSGAGAALKMAGAATAVVAVGAAMKHGIGNALSWETAMTGVSKTVDATEAEITALGKSLTFMSSRIPVGRDELAKLAQVSGQLGVQQKNLKLYVETAAQLGVAVDDLSPEEAIVGLAKFGNVMGTAQEDVAKLGSTLVQLGNTMATTEGSILNMGQRLAAAGRIIGLSEGDVLGLAAALSSVGIEAESGGTAFSKVMVEISKAASSGGAELNEMARISGVTAGEFRQLTKDTPIEAIKGFVVGLKNAQDRGENVFATLEGLGMTSVRLQQALLSASSASDLFTGAIESGNKAFKEGTALAEESEKAFGTTASQLKMVQNTFSNISAEIMTSVLPALSSLAGWANDMLVPSEKVVETFSQFPRPLKDTADAAEDTTDKFQDMLNQMEGSFSLLDTFTITSTDVQHAMELTGMSFHELRGFIEEAQVNAKKWGVDMDLAFKIMASHRRPIKTHVDLLADVAGELDNLDRATREVVPEVRGAMAKWRKSQEDLAKTAKDLATALDISADAYQRYHDLLAEFDVEIETVNKSFNIYEKRLWEVRRGMAKTEIAINALEDEFHDMGRAVLATASTLVGFIRDAKKMGWQAGQTEVALEDVETEFNRLTDTVTVYKSIQARATDAMDDAGEGLENLLSNIADHNVPAREQVEINRAQYLAQLAANAATDEGTSSTSAYTDAVREANEQQRLLETATSDVMRALQGAGFDANQTAMAFAILEEFGVKPAVQGFDLFIELVAVLAKEMGMAADVTDELLRRLGEVPGAAAEAAAVIDPHGESGGVAAAAKTDEELRRKALRVAARRMAMTPGYEASAPPGEEAFEEAQRIQRRFVMTGKFEDEISKMMDRNDILRFLEGTFQGVSFGQGPSSKVLGLQHGGIVRSPTLAMIGEAGPEAVVPLRGGGGAGGIGGGGGANVVVNVQGNLLTEHDLQQVILRTVQDGLRGGSFSHIERSLVPQIQ